MAVPSMPSVMAAADVPKQPFQTYLSFLSSPHVGNSPFLVPLKFSSARTEEKYLEVK